MKCKMIGPYNDELQLEDSMNTWFEENDNVKVNQINYQMSINENEVIYSVMIIYMD